MNILHLLTTSILLPSPHVGGVVGSLSTTGDILGFQSLLTRILWFFCICSLCDGVFNLVEGRFQKQKCIMNIRESKIPVY